jgi:hypothetical protein
MNMSRASPQTAADLSIQRRCKALADPGLAVVLLVATLAAWPLLTRASMPPFTDAHSHIFRTYEILTAWREGILYPRWAPDFYFGYGYPVFDYYSTLSYYLAAAYGWFFGPVAGVKFALVLTTYLAAAGVYVFARDEWGAAPAIVSAAVFVFTPYIVLVEPIQRGGLPEALAVALAPWVLWSFTRLARTGSLAFWCLSATSLAALVLAHNLMSFVFIGLVCAWLAWRWSFIERPASRAALLRALALLATAGLLAAALSAYMWLPAALERGAVQFQNAFSLVQARRYLSFEMIFAPMTGRDIETVDIALYQFRLGWPQWMLGLLGALTLLRPSPQRPASLFWLLVTPPCLFLMDPVSSWFWDHVSLLPYLQFSYRLMAVTALNLAFLAGAVVNGLPAVRLPFGPNGLAVLLAAITIIAGLPLLNPAPWPDFGPVNPEAILNLELFRGRGVGTTFEGEFLPVTVRATPEPSQAVVAAVLAGSREKVDRTALPAGAAVDETAHDSLRNVFSLNAPAPFTLRLFTFYWPGWTAYLDDARTPIIVTAPEGFISVAVPAGNHSLTVQLEDTAPRRLGWALSGAALLILLASGAASAWPGQHHAPNADQPPPTHLARQPAMLLAVTAVSGVLARGALDFADRWQAAHTVPRVPNAQVQRFTRFDDGMALVAYDLPQLTARPGGQVALRVYFEAVQNMAEPASVFVHLYGPDGQLWGQGDQPDPLLFYPTTRWPLGQPMADDVSATLKPNAPPGQYTLAVGLWNRATGARSHPLDAANQPTDQEKVTLTESFQVVP